MFTPDFREIETGVREFERGIHEFGLGGGKIGGVRGNIFFGGVRRGKGVRARGGKEG